MSEPRIQTAFRLTKKELDFLKNRAKAKDVSVTWLIRHEYIGQLMNKEKEK